MMLSVHPEISLSQDPYIPLFRSLRNAIVRHSGLTIDGFDPHGPTDEYYYFENRLKVMELVQAGDLNIPVDQSELPLLKEMIGRRMALSSPLLIPHLNHLRGSTYKELFESALQVVAKGRDTPGRKWLGFNDNWSTEFFLPIARSFPDARFLIIIRDVRASVASGRRDKDPTTVPVALSFVRNWRKHVALAYHYKNLDLFRNRLHVLTYEHLVNDPEKSAQDLCHFLEVNFDPNMIDTSKFIAPEGGPWIPNSNFAVPQQGIYKTSIDQWTKNLSTDLIRLVEFVALPELKFLGYSITQNEEDSDYYQDLFRRMVKDNQECPGWRTDNRDSLLDFSLELLRHLCMEGKISDPNVIKRCFLFPEMYQNLTKAIPLFDNR